MYITDDPRRDFDRWDAEQIRQRERLPKCDYCREPIDDDFYYCINGENICEDCMDKLFKKTVCI